MCDDADDGCAALRRGMGLTISSVFNRLFGKAEMRILMGACRAKGTRLCQSENKRAKI